MKLPGGGGDEDDGDGDVDGDGDGDGEDPEDPPAACRRMQHESACGSHPADRPETDRPENGLDTIARMTIHALT